MLRRVDGFRRFIEESEKDRAQFAERKNLFTEYLPYAIVFGATEKWARTFAGLGDEPPDTSSWYVSQHAFNYLIFSSAINSFTVASAGTLVSTPPSTPVRADRRASPAAASPAAVAAGAAAAPGSAPR